MPGKDDVVKLVIAAQEGDPDAFNELYNVSSSDLEVVGYSILHKKEDVEDALQETYITIYRSFSGQGIAPLQKPESFLPWAKQIMRNTCLTQLDHKKRKAGKDELRPMNSEEDKEGMDTIDNADDDRDFSPEDAAEANYIRSLITMAMSDIPAIRQTCLALHQQGLSYHEIGQKLHIPEGTAKSHVRYARVQLQKVVKEIEKRENVQIHGIVPIPLGLDKVMYLVKLKASKETKAASWIAADSTAVAGAASLKHAAPKAALRKKIAAIAMAVVVAGSGAGVAVSQSIKNDNNFDAAYSRVAEDNREAHEKDPHQMDISDLYKALNESRQAADPQLNQLIPNTKLEKVAQGRAKLYAQQGDNNYKKGGIADYGKGFRAEDPLISESFVISENFVLSKLDGKEVSRRSSKKVGAGCYEKNGQYYWVVAYGE